ncbi:MAG: M23 family metallopeptidase [Treponema sp.]|nr:M23 family metallopeptidase [Treponema sp.]
MVKFGKGFVLAFFLLLSVICHAQEYPAITRLDRQDLNFRQFITEVEANRRRVFNLNKNNANDVRAIADHLTIYQYVPGESDTLFSLHARCVIPYWTLASLNRVSTPSMHETGRPILIPSAPGLFIPEQPDSALERLMISNQEQLESHSVEITIRNPVNGTSSIYYFFPGAEFSSTEMAFFLSSGFIFPLRNFVRQTSGFGSRRNPVTGRNEFHGGIDIAATAGTEVYSVASGTVITAGYDRFLGNHIRIRHANNFVSVYGHLQRIATGITVNSSVAAGTLIGYVGTTGQSTGPHLHFELHQNGTPQNPNQHLPPGRR